MSKCKKLSSVPFIAATALMLTACANSTVPSAPNKPPADLAQSCPALQPLTGTTGAQILPWALQTVHLYNDCKARHEALVQAMSAE